MSIDALYEARRLTKDNYNGTMNHYGKSFSIPFPTKIKKDLSALSNNTNWVGAPNWLQAN